MVSPFKLIIEPINPIQVNSARFGEAVKHVDTMIRNRCRGNVIPDGRDYDSHMRRVTYQVQVDHTTVIFGGYSGPSQGFMGLEEIEGLAKQEGLVAKLASPEPDR